MRNKRYLLLTMVIFLLGCLGGFFVSESGDDLCVFTRDCGDGSSRGNPVIL